MAVTYSVCVSGEGIDSFLGFEYCDVITLASRVFRILLQILPSSLRFLRSEFGLRWPSCWALLAQMLDYASALSRSPILCAFAVGESIPFLDSSTEFDYSRVTRVRVLLTFLPTSLRYLRIFGFVGVTWCDTPTFLAYPLVFLTCGPFIGFFRLLWRSSEPQLRWRRSPRLLQRRFFC